MYHSSQSISAIASTSLFCTGDILAQWNSPVKGSSPPAKQYPAL
jgi:hypothetical protein